MTTIVPTWTASFTYPPDLGGQQFEVLFTLRDGYVSAVSEAFVTGTQQADRALASEARLAVYDHLRDLTLDVDLSVSVNRVSGDRIDFWLRDRDGYRDESTVARQRQALTDALDSAHHRNI